jgi:Nicotinate phosphoribosyltransferase (NAPRTase) N-terminal domain
MNALLTDLYQLTMAQAYYELGMSEIAVFELFVRRMPAAREPAPQHPALSDDQCQQSRALRDRRARQTARGFRYAARARGRRGAPHCTRGRGTASPPSASIAAI